MSCLKCFYSKTITIIHIINQYLANSEHDYRKTELKHSIAQYLFTLQIEEELKKASVLAKFLEKIKQTKYYFFVYEE